MLPQAVSYTGIAGRKEGGKGVKGIKGPLTITVMLQLCTEFHPHCRALMYVCCTYVVQYVVHVLCILLCLSMIAPEKNR